MYEYTDQIIRYLNKRFIRIFGKAKGLMSFDELNVINYSHEMYDKLQRISRDAFLILAKRIYQDNVDKADIEITEDWILTMLDDYDPVTKYVETHEMERKRARFAESVIASPDKAKDIDAALRLWSAMMTHYADEATDRALLQAYRSNGVKQVIWETVHDERRCGICRKRDGKVYDINKVPPRPHLGCRCHWKPYTGGKNGENQRKDAG